MLDWSSTTTTTQKAAARKWMTENDPSQEEDRI